MMENTNRAPGSDSGIPAQPKEWSTNDHIGFGLLAALPITLLALSVLTAIAVPLFGTPLFVPVALVYTHVITQLIVLMIYGHLLFANKTMGTSGKVLWALFFLVAAPAAVLVYWYIHVLTARRRRISRTSVIPMYRPGRVARAR